MINVNKALEEYGVNVKDEQLRLLTEAIKASKFDFLEFDKKDKV